MVNTIRLRLGTLAVWFCKVLDPWARLSYSQEGEDLVLDRLLTRQGQGFYVDVGAHHPKRFSNTHFYYIRGWRGINVEPNPAGLALFEKIRSRDVNLQLGVSDQEGELLYYEFDDPALNTFDESLKLERERDTTYRVVATQRIAVKPLSLILESNLPPGQAIDFLTVDVEGLDLNVLRSNDWSRYRPRCVVSEALSGDLSKGALEANHLVAYMSEQDYRLVAKTCNSWFFLDKREFAEPSVA